MNKKNKNKTTHTFIVYKEKNKFYWFEHSFESNGGIHGPFDSIDDVIVTVHKKMENNEKDNGFISYLYGKPNFDIGVEEFMNFCKRGKLMIKSDKDSISTEELINSLFSVEEEDSNEYDEKTESDEINEVESIENYLNISHEYDKYNIISGLLNKYATSEEVARFEEEYISIEKKLDIGFFDAIFMKFSGDIKRFKILYEAVVKDKAELEKSEEKISVKVPAKPINMKNFSEKIAVCVIKIEALIDALVEVEKQTHGGNRISPSAINTIKSDVEEIVKLFSDFKDNTDNYEYEELTYKEYVKKSGIELTDLVSGSNEKILKAVKSLKKSTQDLNNYSFSTFEKIFAAVAYITPGWFLFLLYHVLYAGKNANREFNWQTLQNIARKLKKNIRIYVDSMNDYSNNLKKYVKKL